MIISLLRVVFWCIIVQWRSRDSGTQPRWQCCCVWGGESPGKDEGCYDDFARTTCASARFWAGGCSTRSPSGTLPEGIATSPVPSVEARCTTSGADDAWRHWHYTTLASNWRTQSTATPYTWQRGYVAEKNARLLFWTTVAPPRNQQSVSWLLS